MTLILFIFAVALLAAAVVDRWRRRAVLIVSTAEGVYRGRRALRLAFALVEVELVEAGDRSLPGLIFIPRRRITVVQALPADPEAVARSPLPSSRASRDSA